MGRAYLQKLYPLGLGFDCGSEHLKQISEMPYFK